MKTTTRLLLAALSAGSLTAETTFVFGNETSGAGGFFDGKTTGAYTEGSIEITMTSQLDAFNADSDGFGMNQSAGGDDTDGFDFTDGGSGLTENFTISFDQDVQLISFAVSSFGASDEITLMDGTTIVATITSTGTTLLANYALSNTSSLSVNTTAGTYGNGWEFESVTVVPEPGTYALIAGMLGLTSVMLSRRK